MDWTDIEHRGLVLLGCGKMGGALLQGWLGGGLKPASVWVLDPQPPAWLDAHSGLHVNEQLPENPAVAVVAVKPQIMADALPALRPLGNGETLFLSIAAGISIEALAGIVGDRTPIIRAMPNTPAAIGRGISALVGNDCVGEAGLAVGEGLMAAVGQTVRLSDEGQMDAVTAVSGSGPAYVFLLIEALAAAGEREGLPGDLAMRLAKATVAGAGALAEASDETPSQLRVNVTSPGGTTAAALEVLMQPDTGLPALMERAVRAAANRSRELGA